MTCRTCKKFTDNKTAKVLVNGVLIEIHIPSCDNCTKTFKDKALKFLSNPMIKAALSVIGLDIGEIPNG